MSPTIFSTVDEGRDLTSFNCLKRTGQTVGCTQSRAVKNHVQYKLYRDSRTWWANNVTDVCLNTSNNNDIKYHSKAILQC